MKSLENGGLRPRARSGVAEEWLDKEVFLYDQENAEVVQ